ncbi:MAG: HEAT repeat domain-containing protein [Asgard group archaeon]|nr:HEAT repeat domain-containing protein [Asgard group archaeon]
MIGTKEAKEIIIEQAQSEDPEICYSATSYAVGIRHPKVKELINTALTGKNNKELVTIANDFLSKNIHTDNFTETLIAVLVESFLDKKKTYFDRIAYALAQNPKISLPLLKEKLKTKDESYRLLIASIIGRMDSNDSKDMMIKLMSDNNPDIRCLSLETMCSKTHPKLQEEIVSMLHDKDLRIKSKAFEIVLHTLMIENFDDNLIRILVQNYLKKNDMNCARVILLLKKLESKAVPVLIEELQNSDYNIRRFAAEILCEITVNSTRSVSKILQVKKATKRLTEMLADPEPKVRRGAAFALRSIRDVKSLNDMIKGLTDSDLYVRRNLITCLGDMRATAAIKTLEKMKPREDKTTQGLIKKALQNIKKS